MNRIVVARSGDPVFDRHTMQEMFKFRYKVFREQLEWDVKTCDGLEIDEYDQQKPVYMVAKNPMNLIEGCWRFLPTTGIYMLKDTFPQLLRGEPAPVATDIWELSRFAVVSSDRGDLAQASIGTTTFEMIRRAVEYADAKGIRHYVTVTSVGLERALRSAGIPLRRFGDGKAERVGKVLSVACWIDIDDHLRQVVCKKQQEPSWHRKVA